MLAFSALADPTRYRIVEILAVHGRMPVSQISRYFSLTAPAISQHLKVLRQARLVQVEVKAQQRIYALNPEGLSEVEQWIAEMKHLWKERFDALDAVLKEDLWQSATSQGENNDR